MEQESLRRALQKMGVQLANTVAELEYERLRAEALEAGNAAMVEKLVEAGVTEVAGVELAAEATQLDGDGS